jgi:hypothetical protein
MIRPLMLAFALVCPTVLSALFKPADAKHPRTLTVPSPLPPAETVTRRTTVLVERVCD